MKTKDDQIRDSVRMFLSSSRLLQENPVLLQLALENLSECTSRNIAIPTLSCVAAGGTERDAIPIIASWILLDLAASLLDKVQDGDDLPSGALNSAHAINLSVCGIAAAFHNLSSKPLVLDILLEAVFYSAIGQQAQLELEAQDKNELDSLKSLENYWKSVLLKSGNIMRAPAAAGAAAVTKNRLIIERIGDFSSYVGVILQILDDCQDAFSTDIVSQATLPWILYYYAVGEKPSKDEVVTYEMMKSAKVPEMAAGYLSSWQNEARSALEELANNIPDNIIEEMMSLIPEGEL
jgi:geranylgeranyl pyrophosphate synthase